MSKQTDRPDDSLEVLEQEEFAPGLSLLEFEASREVLQESYLDFLFFSALSSFSDDLIVPWMWTWWHDLLRQALMWTAF